MTISARLNWRVIVCVTILITASGCRTALPGSYCLVYEPVYLTVSEREALADDGAELVIDGNNAAWLEGCS